MVNRIEKYFEKIEVNNVNKFEHVEFEEFDPKIIQNVTKENDGEFSDYENDENYSTTQKIIISQDSQMLQTLKLWIGHSDIELRTKLALSIEEVPGVETLDIITRYRFRVGIGKLFKENEVKSRISEVINKSTKVDKKKKRNNPNV